MNMSGGFSDSVEKVLETAGEVAIKFGNTQIGTEHVLFGLVAYQEALASKVLNEYGVTKASMLQLFNESDTISIGGFLTQVELSPRVKEMLKISQKIAIELGHNYIGTEHLLLALISSTGSYAVRLLVTYYKVNLTALKNSLLSELNAAGKQNQSDTTSAKGGSTLPEELLQMGSDLTQNAKEHKIDPIIGREEEIQRLVEILARKTKNNPVLIGEAGVGKTAVVEGLALAIVSGDVPESLKNKTVYSLEIGSLMAGTKYRGSMEEKLKNAIEKIIENKNIIVFIDEIHTLAQAGSEKGETSPADMLKPYLARGELQTIGATTTDEYRKYIEKDKALERRFQPIMVNPPSVEQTIEILRGLKDSYEAFHKVIISDEAIVAAATLSDRYITDRSLPDKAIDLIDEASSKAKVSFNLKPSKLREKEEELKKIQANRDEASVQRNYEKAAKLQTQIINLENEVDALIEDFEKNRKTSSNTIGGQEIAAVVSKWTQIPVTKITETEKEKLINLEEILKKRVIGQTHAIEQVAKAIRRSRVGIQDSKRPIGSFLFVGQTGVGKTELSKALAEAMFDNENNIIRVDMSEYMERHTVSKLIGSPPGYVGYNEGGQLTEQVRRKPYSVVLFDEVEKAHQEVLNTLLQILDDGRLTDSQGRVINFSNTIIIMTSNVGAGEIAKQRLGFKEGDDKIENIEALYLDKVKRFFRPEFVNRIDSICVFEPLSKEDLVQVANIMLNNLNKRLKNQNLEVSVSKEAIDYIVLNGYDSSYGARPLKRYIQSNIEDKLAEYILLDKIEKQGIVYVNVENGVLTFESN